MSHPITKKADCIFRKSAFKAYSFLILDKLNLQCHAHCRSQSFERPDRRISVAIFKFADIAL